MITDTPMNRCPACTSTFVRPLMPAWWQVYLFRFTAKRPHECWHCGWRGWRVPLPVEMPSDRAAAQTPFESRPAKRPGSRTYVA
jgi:hypothetical protein